MPGVMMSPALAVLGWTVNASASGPVPLAPPPPNAKPPFPRVRSGNGQPSVTKAASMAPTYVSLMAVSTPQSPSGSHNLVKGPVRRKGPGHSLVHLLGHVVWQRCHTGRDRRRAGRHCPGRESPVGIREPGPERLEHPRLGLDRGFREDHATHRPARPEPDRDLDGPVRCVDPHEPQRADDTLALLAGVEGQHAVVRAPIDRLVQPVRVDATQVHEAVDWSPDD